ncbi:MAG: T9SS type A sorting domain-containing protein [Phaeodactylibacter sp.]|nr:T9SS type A sorting domain-containing protein [Phaeodactylibacter sp.]
MKKCLTFLAMLLAVNTAFQPLFSQTRVGAPIEGLSPGDTFGESVSLSADGSRIAVGWTYDGSDNSGFKGAVEVFELVDGNWENAYANITCPWCGDAYSAFGTSVSLSADGDRVAIATPGETDSQVYVFEDWNGPGWAELGSFDGPDFGFARSISASSDCVRVAAATGGNGALVYELMLTDEVPFEIYVPIGQRLNLPEPNYFGTAVSISADGNRVAVGGEDNSGFGTIAVFDYAEDTETWVPAGEPIFGDDPNGFMGNANTISLSADGSRLAVASPSYGLNEESIPGEIEVYEWDEASSSWDQLGTALVAENFGNPVALSPAGNRLATSSYVVENDSTAVFSVKVFQWDGENWAPFGEDISGDRVNEYFGASLSFSSDGNRLAIGAYSDEGGPAGRVLVYDLSMISSSATVSAEDNLRVFPNPTSGLIELAGVDRGLVKVMDQMGRTLFQEDAAQTPIDLTGLPGGVYFIQALSGSRPVVRKVVKK